MRSSALREESLAHKIRQAIPFGATRVASVSFTSNLAFFVHNFCDKTFRIKVKAPKCEEKFS